MLVGSDGVGKRTITRKLKVLMKINIRDYNLLGINRGIKRIVVRDDKEVGNELKNDFKVVGKGWANERQDSGMDKKG